MSNVLVALFLPRQGQHSCCDAHIVGSISMFAIWNGGVCFLLIF